MISGDQNTVNGHSDDLLKHIRKENILCDVVLVAGADVGENKTKCALN